MSGGILASWKRGDRATVNWIEFGDYARRVFAGEPGDWLRNPVGFVTAMNQALSVIATDVISIDAFGPFGETLERGMERDRAALANALMETPAPLAFVDDVVKAFSHRYASTKDLVLKLPVPHDLLVACGVAEDDARAFDHLDDLTMSLCSFLRRYADRNIDGILLSVQGDAGLSEDEVDAYGPLFATARHYGWFAGVVLPGSTVGPLPAIDCDLFLFPEVSAARLGAGEGTPLGGGLGSDFWLGTEELPAACGRFVFYGLIPAAAEPERVVQRCKALGSV